MALRRIRDGFVNNNPCVDLMENFLCHYYFPPCNLVTGEITPVCSDSCALLANNENCSMLRKTVDMQLNGNGITPINDTCTMTYRHFDNPPRVASNCTSIES